MSHYPHRRVTSTEWWLEWAAEHGVGYDDGVKSFGELARDYYETSDSCWELASLERGEEAPTASERMAASLAYARALLIEAAIVARGRVLNSSVDPIEVVDPTGWGVPRHQTHEADPRWEPTQLPDAPPEPLSALHDIPTVTRGWRS
jgi:hypothetical protein